MYFIEFVTRHPVLQYPHDLFDTGMALFSVGKVPAVRAYDTVRTCHLSSKNSISSKNCGTTIGKVPAVRAYDTVRTCHLSNKNNISSKNCGTMMRMIWSYDKFIIVTFGHVFHFNNAIYNNIKHNKDV